MATDICRECGGGVVHLHWEVDDGDPMVTIYDPADRVVLVIPAGTYTWKQAAEFLAAPRNAGIQVTVDDEFQELLEELVGDRENG